MEKISIRSILPLLSLVFVSCAGSMLTPQGFENIRPGTSIVAVEELYGSPYEVKQLGNGFQEHTYISRSDVTRNTVLLTTYKLYVTDGKVISKNCSSEESTVEMNF